MRDEGRSGKGRTDGSLFQLNLAPAVLPAALFGLFTFTLGSTGVLSDAILAGGEVDVPLYNMRETMLFSGFLVYGLVSWRRPRALSAMAARGFRVLLAALYACCMLVSQLAPGGIPCVIAVALMALVVGFSSGSALEMTALLASRRADAMRLPWVFTGQRLLRDGATRMLGLIVGVGGSLAVVAQSLLLLLLPFGGWFGALLVACFCLLVYLAGTASQECLDVRMCSTDDAGHANGAGSVGFKKAAYLVVVVLCLFMLFPFYEVTLRDVFTWAVFLQWHRFLGVVGYLVVGVAAFLGGRRAASLAVVVAALFTVFVLTETALFQVGDFTMALFFTLYGAVVAYGAICFMAIAPQTAHPAVMASMSRLLGEAMTIAEGAMVALVGWSPSIVLLATLALLALTIILMVLGGFFAPPAGGEPRKEIKQDEGEPAAGENEPALDAKGLPGAHELPLESGEALPCGGELSPDAEEAPRNAQQVVAIAQRYGLTQRETEVLGLVLRNLTTQQMADDLVITKSTVKFHVTNILKKTGSETRQQLIEKLSDEAEQESQPR